MSRALGRWLLCLSILVAPVTAAAGPTIVVLNFGGEQGDEIRERVAGALGKRYDVLPGQKLLDACDKLGITMSRGKNLAAAAAQLGAVAVVGGTVKDGHLVLAVYSGKTGQPLSAGSIAFGGQITRPALGKSLVLILKGLKKAPKKVGRTPAPQPVAPMPVEVRTKTAGTSGAGTGGARSTGGGALTYDPNAPETPNNIGTAAGSGTGGAAAAGGGTGAEENPLETPKPAPVVAPPPTTVSGGPSLPHPTRVQALLGLGSWLRRFNMYDASPGVNQRPPPRYDSAAFTLRVDFRLYPVAFFLENWPAGFLITIHYQQALGLSSQTDQGTEKKTFGTTMRQFLFGVGYDWKILASRELSPHLELTMGYGFMDFGINWEEGADRTLPGVAYRFFIANLGFRYPFFRWLGAHAGFDYRAVGSSGAEVGEIENDDEWYGASKTGGINLVLGAHGGWKGITATAEYAYTRYFYAFLNEAGRSETSKLIAGGALDELHTLMICLGYTY